jgi:hypothetical protein
VSGRSKPALNRNGQSFEMDGLPTAMLVDSIQIEMKDNFHISLHQAGVYVRCSMQLTCKQLSLLFVLYTLLQADGLVHG